MAFFVTLWGLVSGSKVKICRGILSTLRGGPKLPKEPLLKPQYKVIPMGGGAERWRRIGLLSFHVSPRGGKISTEIKYIYMDFLKLPLNIFLYI